MAYIEATASGCPLIATTMGGAAEAVIEGSRDFWFRRLNVGTSVTAFNCLHSDPALPLRMGETGRQPVIERDDFHLRLHNLQSCLADGRLLAQFILAEKST